MKHFIAVHRFHNEEARRAYCMPPEKKDPPEKPLTSREWVNFANNTNENAKCRQHWVGDDIAFCHWEAESEEAILEWIGEVGIDQLMSTELHEQWRFTSYYDQSDVAVECKEY